MNNTSTRLKALLRSITPPRFKRVLRPRSMLWDWRRNLGDKLVVCRANGTEIRIGVSSEMERFRVDTFATKEPETLAWLDAQLRADDVLFDIGANIGLYALYAAIRRADSRVYAFEPESNNYARLCRNICANMCRNAIPCNFAVSGETGFGLFEVRALEPGAALHGIAGFRMPAPDDHPAVLSQGVATVTLDTLVERYGVPQPTLMKVDVDGVEEKIFEGAQRVLSNTRLRTVLVEMDVITEGPSPIKSSLMGHGFRLAGQSEWTGRFGDTELKNYIFVR